MTTPAWVPETPVGWVVDQTRRYFEVKKELNSDRSISQVLSLTLRGVVQNDPDNPEGLVPSDYGTYQIFDEGDLVFKLIDLENLRTSRVGLVPESGIMSSAYIRLVPRSSMDSRFAYWYYYSLWVRNIYNQLGGGVRATLGSADLLALPVVVPPMEEQRRIADFLDDQVGRIDQAIGLRKTQLELLEVSRRGKLTTMMFDSSRTTQPVRAAAIVQLGRQRSPENADGYHLTPYLRSANVTDGQIRTDDVYEMNFDPAEQRVFELKHGDILVTEGAGSAESVGASARWQGELPGVICFQNTLIRIRPRPGVSTCEYLYWWARASFASGAMRTWASGANILHIGSAGLSRMPIPIRTETEQNQIALTMDAAECSFSAERNSMQVSIQIFEERKRSLITAAVTGHLDVVTARPLAGPWVSNNLGTAVEQPAMATGVAL
jgi:type I restriction enzyme S subunit